MNLEEVTLHISEFLKHDASNSWIPDVPYTYRIVQ